jgi:ribosomal-protein-alanine N-acetyltransferase
MIRLWQDADLTKIARMHADCFIDAWSLDMLKGSFNGNGFYGALIEENGEIVCTICYLITFDEAELLSVVTKQSERGKGHAEKIMAFAETDLKEKGVNNVFLEVRESNVPAISLYKKFGFDEISKRKNYYGTETAVIMKKEL